MGFALFARWRHARKADISGKNRLTRLCLEALEARLLPSLTPHLLKDIDPGPGGSMPAQFTAVGSTTYFTADDGVHGYQLWKSNGTAAGTVMVKDINPTGNGVYYKQAFLTNVNGTLFFDANDGTHGVELWKSNGTAAAGPTHQIPPELLGGS